MRDMSWHDLGDCRGMDAELFYGYEGERQQIREERERDAKIICAGCEVRGTCLSDAIEYQEPAGVWGGLNADERKVIRDERQKVRKADRRRERERGVA